MENANSHPFQVAIVKDAKFFANSHPYQVTVVGGGIGIEGRIVSELPEEGEPGYIYLVLKETSEEGDVYDEYMWVLQQDGETYGWEHIGATNEVTIKLYNETGQNTDGAMTQKAVTDALASAGGAILLTEQDYDYPADNPTSIEIMNLAPGIYQIASNSSIQYKLGTFVNNTRYATFIVGYRDGFFANNKWVILVDSVGVRMANSSLSTIQVLLGSRNIVNNLTSTSVENVLSAAQGKVLKDMIDNLSVAEFVSFSNIDPSTMTATPSKTPAEVKTMVDSGKAVYYKLELPVAIPGLQAGTYLFGVQYSSGQGIIASLVAPATGSSNILTAFYTQSATDSFGSFSVQEMASKTYVDGLIGDINTALQTILNGGES